MRAVVIIGTLTGGKAMAWGDIPNWAPACANALLCIVKEKDLHTYYHCLRVGRLARKLARAMSLSEYEQAVLEMTGLLHDIGKVAVPTDVLTKPGRLNEQEMAIMKSHPEKSVEIIQPYGHDPFFAKVIPGVMYHHERVDGMGYPHKLQGEAIPLSARIVAVVDTFDAMSHARPYRTALPADFIVQELIDCSGTQFDSAIVKVFLEALPHFSLESDFEGPREQVAIATLLKAA
jgi:putative nucleotidyltransferase with HDIG domain